MKEDPPWQWKLGYSIEEVERELASKRLQNGTASKTSDVLAKPSGKPLPSVGASVRLYDKRR